MPVAPVSGSRFPLAIAQRIDVRVQLPRAGAFPILALREGADRAGRRHPRYARSAQSRKLPAKNAAPAELLSLELESRLVAAHPLTPRPVDQSYDLRLQGNMARYEWPINGIVFDTAHPSGQKAQVRVKRGQRVALNFINETGMSHPMHLHGHSFQVIADQRQIAAMGHSATPFSSLQRPASRSHSTPTIPVFGISTATSCGIWPPAWRR